MKPGSNLVFTDVPMTGTVASVAFPLAGIYAYSFQILCTGSPVGTFHLEASNYPGDQSGMTTKPPPDDQWTKITDSDEAITGTNPSILYDVTQASYRWVRLVYVHTSGVATMSSNFNSKG